MNAVEGWVGTSARDGTNVTSAVQLLVEHIVRNARTISSSLPFLSNSLQEELRFSRQIPHSSQRFSQQQQQQQQQQPNRTTLHYQQRNTSLTLTNTNNNNSNNSNTSSQNKGSSVIKLTAETHNAQKTKHLQRQSDCMC
jgi:hypothetical protein